MKNIFSILTIFTFAILLVGCSSNEATLSETDDNDNESDNNEPIEITYWYAWGDIIEQNNLNLVEKFNESQDEIHVTAEYQGNYDELHSATQAAVAAGHAPEVTQNETASIGVFAEGGMTEDLTPFVESDEDFDLDDFIPGLMGNSYVDDKLYGLPYLRSTPLMYMNKTLLEESGLDPEGPQNWEELREYAKTITEDQGFPAISLSVDNWIYEAFLRTNESAITNEDDTEVIFNDEKGVEVLEFWRELHDEGYMKVATGNDASNVPSQDFASNRAAFVFSSTANLTANLEIAEEQGFELNAGFIPKNLQNGVPTGGANLVMTSGLDEEKQQAAWEFMTFMTDTEQTIYSSEFTGYLPNRISAVESEEMLSLYEETPLFKVAVDQLEYAYPRPMPNGIAEVFQVMTDSVTSALVDPNADSKETLDDAAERAQQLID